MVLVFQVPVDADFVAVFVANAVPTESWIFCLEIEMDSLLWKGFLNLSVTLNRISA